MRLSDKAVAVAAIYETVRWLEECVDEGKQPSLNDFRNLANDVENVGAAFGWAVDCQVVRRCEPQ